MNKRKRSPILRIGGFILALFLVGLISLAAYWSFAPASKNCLSCHEIQASYDAWASSSHRDISCDYCHGGTLTAGIHGLRENTGRLIGHFTDSDFEDIRLSEAQVLEMIDRCRSCHATAYASWLGSGHSVTYADIYLNETHNAVEPPNFDCLRCHGMFYEGDIETLLMRNPETEEWAFISAEQQTRAAIPCLTCHEVHVAGQPATRPDYSNPSGIASERPPVERSTGFYDRREKLFFAGALLPRLSMEKDGRSITISNDVTQRICIQCHAPNAAHEPGTSDDRTPRGVHEGLRCTACHDPHTHDARASCAGCHPALSNCGLDVETMDTSFKSIDSRHNIHFADCVDCHEDSLP